MEFCHVMIRVRDLESALHFFVNQLGLKQIQRNERKEGRYTSIYLAPRENDPYVELVHNWDNNEPYPVGRAMGHVCFFVDDLYTWCEELMEKGVSICCPPRNGRYAFVKSPEGVCVEFMQKGRPSPPREPWISMRDQNNNDDW